MQHRKLGFACAVACAAIAATPAVANAATTADVRQNTAKTNKAIEELRAQLGTLGTQVGTLQSKQGAVDFIVAAAPQIVDGLTQLKTGLETLASAYQAVEYGVARVNVAGGGAIVNPPGWSADIPDDGNGATVSGTALYPNLAAVAVSKTFSVNAYVRSNEADADGANGPAAQGGAMLSVTLSNPAGTANSFAVCAGDPTTGGIGGITPAGETINTPSGPIKDQPLTNIATARPRTDQALPGGDAPTLARCTVTIPAAVVPGAVPTVATINWSASFLDIPTTTSPGPRD